MKDVPTMSMLYFTPTLNVTLHYLMYPIIFEKTKSELEIWFASCNKVEVIIQWLPNCTTGSHDRQCRVTIKVLECFALTLEIKEEEKTQNRSKEDPYLDLLHLVPVKINLLEINQSL